MTLFSVFESLFYPVIAIGPGESLLAGAAVMGASSVAKTSRWILIRPKKTLTVQLQHEPHEDRHSTQYGMADSQAPVLCRFHDLKDFVAKDAANG